MTVWECIRRLRDTGLSVKHKGRTLREGLWLVGRPKGRFFVVVKAFASLDDLGKWVEGERA